jgi:Zn-dependent protease with chaperone function
MKTTILLVTFLLELAIALFTVFIKASDLEWSLSFSILCIIGIISAAIFLIIAFGEIISSKNIGKSDKIILITGLLLIFNITAIIYLAYSRKNIASASV